MNFFTFNSSTKTKVLLIILFFLYVGSRCYFLFTFPPFTDESLYTRWGQMMVTQPMLRWLSLQYLNRQPLALWIFGIGALVFRHPLYGGRMMVLLMNIPVFFLIWSLCTRLFTRKVAMFSLLFLSLSPFFIQIQTLALMDGCMFAITALILWFLTVPKRRNIPVEIIAVSFLLSVALWIKTTALLLIIPILFTLFWNRISGHLTNKQLFLRFALVICIPFVCILPLLLHRDVQHIINEPRSFIVSSQTLIHIPLAVWGSNIVSSLISLLLYLNPLAILFTVIGTMSVSRRYRTLFLVWFLIPWSIAMLIGKSVVVRYYGIGLVGLLPLIGNGMSVTTSGKKRIVIICFTGIILTLHSAIFLTKTETFFHFFPESSGERSYAISWTSGYGIPELVQWIDQHIPSDKRVNIIVSDSPGNPGDYLASHYYFQRNINMLFLSFTDEEKIRSLKQYTDRTPIHVVARKSQITDFLRPYLIPIIILTRPYDTDDVGLYFLAIP